MVAAEHSGKILHVENAVRHVPAEAAHENEPRLAVPSVVTVWRSRQHPS